jgi:hypothetical protein
MECAKYVMAMVGNNAATSKSNKCLGKFQELAIDIVELCRITRTMKTRRFEFKM